jgi:hypothetical protein
MNSNNAHKKLVELAPVVPFSEFERVLKEEATPSNPVKVGWITKEGKNRYYFMYYIDGPIGTDNAGGSETKALEGMVNIPVVGLKGTWRTLTWGTVYKFRFNGKTYRVT